MGTGQHKAGVSQSCHVYDGYKQELGKARNELFAQFFMRILKEIACQSEETLCVSSQPKEAPLAGSLKRNVAPLFGKKACRPYFS
ncbi:hypothetical protein [Helicobacter felis]|uniref:hypothetical protein n=1 Tax=Helicobacter felis TaxID=214 RepID=UPI001F488472|nr:hypothetical protein [Helicobacter felis]